MMRKYIVSQFVLAARFSLVNIPKKIGQDLLDILYNHQNVVCQFILKKLKQMSLRNII